MHPEVLESLDLVSYDNNVKPVKCIKYLYGAPAIDHAKLKSL